MAIREVLVDKRTLRVPFPASTANAIGDLLWWDNSAKVGKTASVRTDLGSAGANQLDFTPLFLGVAGDQRLSTETSTTPQSDRLVITESVFDCDCSSATWEFGDYVGVDRSSTPANYNQQVVKVTDRSHAIGYVVKRESSAVTKVRCFLSAYSFGYFQRTGGGFTNFSATTDPGVNNDNTQGYAPGSVWINTSASRVWMCQSNATGAAVWLLDGVVPGVGIEPSSMLTYFGGGTASFPEEGNINRQISSAGVQPGATGADNVLAVYSLPASSFDASGRGLQISAAGSFGATANTKRIKIIVNPATAVVGSTVGAGGTTVADTGAVTTNGGGWQLSANVFKYGANGSNTQIGIHSQAQMGGAVGTLLAPSLITATESGAILIAVTGNATTAASDIVFNWLEINAMN